MRIHYDVDSLENRDPRAIAQLDRLLGPFLERWFEPEVRGLGQIPDGPALYVGNHNGGLCSADTFILGTHLHRERGLGAVPYGLAHQWVLGWPLVHQLLVPLGAVRACHRNAHRIFDRGGKVLVYPGGDIDSVRPSHQRDRIVFGPRRGYVKLALRAGVPIVPIVAAGAHDTFHVFDDGRWLAEALGLHRHFRLDVFPTTLSIPWGLSVGAMLPYFPLPTRILIEAMEPVVFDRRGEEAARDDAYVEACHRRVHGAMERTLRRLLVERARRGPPRAAIFARAATRAAA